MTYRSMIRTFDKHGLTFQYPENWKLEEETVDDGARSVSLFCPGGGFWSVTAYPADVEPAAASEQTLEAMRAEYPDLDVEAVSEDIAGRQLEGYEMSFVCLDMVNTAKVLCYGDSGATYVILCQAEDRDYEDLADVFAAVTTSLLSPR
jgi:hypothetical protein